MRIKERYETETVSHSGLTKLDNGPRAYRSYKAREDTSTRGMDLGSAVHCEILEPDEFQDRYSISDMEIPTGKNAVFVKTLFNTRKLDSLGVSQDEYEEEWVANAFNVSELKSSPQKVWDSFKGDTDAGRKLQAYWDFLEESEGKFKLSPSDIETISRCKDSIQTHKKASELLYGYTLSDTYEELDIIWEYPGYDFKMRSIIDKLIINKEEMKILVVDLKTSAKNVYNFVKPYESYKYYRQLALYKKAVMWYVKNVLKLEIEEWEIETYIVAVQTTGHNECAVYAPSDSDLIRGDRENLDSLNTMKWHFDEDKWDYPKEYYLGDGVLTLELDGQEEI